MVEVGTQIRIKKSLKHKSWYSEEFYTIVKIIDTGSNAMYALDRPLPNNNLVIWCEYVEILTTKDIRLQKLIEINNV